MSGHQMCYAEVSNGTFASRAGGHSPLHISPPSLVPSALPLPVWVLAPSSALAPVEPPLPQCLPLPPPCATIPPLLHCHELSPCLHFCSPKSQVSSLSPPPFCSPHMNMGFIFLAHQWQNPIFFTRNQFIIDYKHRIRAYYSTKHTSSGCFPAQKNTNFQWIICTCMKVTIPRWESNMDSLYIFFFSPAHNILHYVKKYRALRYFAIYLSEEI